jgi:hypothetical protein
VGQKLLGGLFVAATVVIGMSTVGYAQQGGPAPPTRAVPVVPDPGGFRRVSPPTFIAHAPEIDPATATAALAMLAGGILMIRARRR